MKEGLGSSWAPGQLEPGTIWCLSASLCLSLIYRPAAMCPPPGSKAPRPHSELLSPQRNWLLVRTQNSWGKTLIGLAESAPAEGPEEGSRGI